MDRSLSRHALTPEEFEYVQLYVLQEGISFRDLDHDFNVKFATVFGAQGHDAELALLESKLDFQYPANYVRLATGDDGSSASGHFKSGWWKVADAPDACILWSFTLSLSGNPSEAYPDENTCQIEARFRDAGIHGVPFGYGARFNKRERIWTSGWLYFDRADHSLSFAEFDFAASFPISHEFMSMMDQARFVGYDA